MFSPGIEPGTFCVLDRCDNRYTTKTRQQSTCCRDRQSSQPLFVGRSVVVNKACLPRCIQTWKHPNVTPGSYCQPVTVTSQSGRDRLVVRTLRCGRSNPGSNPGHGIFVSYFFLKIQIQPGLLEIILNGGNFFQMIQSNKNMRRPGIEPGSTAWKAAMLTIIPPTPHIALGFYLDCSREQFLSKCVLEFLQVWINCWYCVLSWGYSSVVEQSAAVRQVHGSNPCVPYKFFSSNIYMFCQIWICNGRVILLEL